MTEDQIKHMVDRFLGWRLPENFAPDAGISFKAEYNEHTAYPMKHEPTGTNLLDATQAEVMVRHMVEGMPASDALERAEREHGERLDCLAAEITALRNDAERDERDLRAAAASEAAMREAAKAFLHHEVGGVVPLEGVGAALYDVLATPASALAQRYEAVVTAARAYRRGQRVDDDGKVMDVIQRMPALRDALDAALAAFDHPTPAKDQET